MIETFQKQRRNPLTTFIVGLIAGLLFGLIILGWWLWPVQWTDGAPSDLAVDGQVEWLKMAIKEYAYSGDPTTALSRYAELGEEKTQALVAVGNYLDDVEPDLYTAYVMAVEPGQATNIVLGTPVTGEVSEADTNTDKKASQNILGTLLPIFCGIGVAILAAVGIYFVLRKLSSNKTPQNGEQAVEEEVEPIESVKSVASPIIAASEATPIGQYVASYHLGDKGFDQSFSIFSPQGEYLGECGTGILEPIGVGEPKKVSAFDVWLFDKYENLTVTKVLMSAHAFRDDVVHDRLAVKGELVEVHPDTMIELETETVMMTVQVRDMAYGEGPLPAESFFELLTIELLIWPKSRG